MGKIHSIETFGAVDGPGIRFVIFLQGCPMRCQYCHNPDTWDTFGGKEMSVEELLVEVRKYRHYYGTTGGVTVTGGEPLLQIDFVIELFKALKAENIGTCIDTSGVLFSRVGSVKAKYDELMEYTDLVLLDLKHIDNTAHKSLTGHENTHILDFAKYLDEKHIPIWVRHVVIPTITMNETYLKGLRAFIDSLSNVEKIEVLPYHTMGVQKYKNLGITYPLEGVPTPTKAEMDIANTILIKGREKR